jgi:hypothetical protein
MDDGGPMVELAVAVVGLIGTVVVLGLMVVGLRSVRDASDDDQAAVSRRAW